MKIKWFFLTCFCCLMFTSCFEVAEELFVHDDGSGTMTLTINLSQSKTKVAQILLLDHINGLKVPTREKIKTDFDQALAQLKKQPGITEVRGRLDMENFIATIKFSFHQVEDVNSIVKNIVSTYHIPAPDISAYHFDRAKKLLTWDYQYYPGTKTSYQNLSTENKKAFTNARFTSITRFESLIEHMSNPSAKISANKKAVMQQSMVLPLINGSTDLSNKIQLKN